MEPTINVNLKPCDCALSSLAPTYPPKPHADHCSAKPGLLTCPLPDKVELTVRLGRCECAAQYRGVTGFGVSEPQGKHTENCPARHIRVICSIGGDGTWSGSEVAEMEILGGTPLGIDARNRIHRICRDRWALVKALVLGKFAYRDVGDAGPGTPEGLFKQRDVVFANLAEMAQAEQAHREKSMALFEAIRAADHDREHVTNPYCYAIAWDDGHPNAEAGLRSYLSMLIAQVGAL